GLPDASPAIPLPIASSRPRPISRCGSTRNARRAAAGDSATANSANAAEAISPPTNPPPGSLCPRSIRNSEKSSSNGWRNRAAVLRMRDGMGWAVVSGQWSVVSGQWAEPLACGFAPELTLDSLRPQSQQGIHSDSGDGEHGDFTQRVDAA